MSILRRKMKDAAARKRASAAGPEKALLSGKTLTLPLALEDGRVPGLLQNIAFFAGVLVVLGVVWASVAQIRELAVGHGEVVPVDAVQNAHHLEGGIVEDVLVEEGQIVSAGTPLLKLRPNAAASDLEQLAIRAASLEMQKERLRVLLRGGKFNVGEKSEAYPDLHQDQLDLYRSQLALREQEERTLQARIDQRILEHASLIEEIASAKRAMDLTDE